MLVTFKQIKSIETKNINENAWVIASIAIINIVETVTIILWVGWLITLTSGIWAIVIKEQELGVEKWDIVL